jgi:hypothetical protein
MSERILSFRPFRRVDNKLVVTSYMGWRKIYTANYGGATVRLLPFPEITKGEVVYAMGNPNGEYKFWHPTKFESLFWPIHGKIRHVAHNEKSAAVFEAGVVIKYDSYESKEDEVSSGFDSEGCPTFSHITAVYVSENYPYKMHLFEPLTADIVYKYFEIMRDVLTNVKWQQTPKQLIKSSLNKGK